MKNLVLALSLAALAASVSAYPLDGQERTGIRRLAGTIKQTADPSRRNLMPGALYDTSEIELSLSGAGRALDLGAEDPALKKALEGIFASRDPSYLFAVADITDPANLRWAGLREDQTQYPGSVGKILCALALFDGLARAFPDTSMREKVLRETIIEADSWSAGDSHSVPHYDPSTGYNRSAPISTGDRFTLSEWLDHALSASANSAGSMVWREAMLLRRLGAKYPGTPAERQAVLSLPGSELARLAQQVIVEPLEAAGIDTKKMRQGTFWTRSAQARVPGIASFASPRELVRFLLRLEQGRLVDPWSSLELKRYMYFTRKRYRYCHAPELAYAAVYFKSGSLYDCEPEPGFSCGKYRGNARNVMNSIAIIETPARAEWGTPQRRYLVALMSNVLRVNSAWDHSRLAAAIDEAVRTRQAPVVDEHATPAEQREAGTGE